MAMIKRVTIISEAYQHPKPGTWLKLQFYPCIGQRRLRMDMTITADGGVMGVTRDTIDLVVAEGLRQLGLTDVDITSSTRFDRPSQCSATYCQHPSSTEKTQFTQVLRALAAAQM